METFRMNVLIFWVWILLQAVVVQTTQVQIKLRTFEYRPSDLYPKYASTLFRRLTSIQPAQVDPITLKSFLGTLYIGTVKINREPYALQIDTGSADLWVACTSMEGEVCLEQCPVGTTAIQYGSGNVCVELKVGDVQLGKTKLVSYAFGVAHGKNVISGNHASVSLGGAQGILGLAYNKVAAIPQPGKQLIEALSNFSIYLAPRHVSQAEDESLLILNGLHDELMAKYKLIGYKIPLKEMTHWKIPLVRVQIGNDTDFVACKTLEHNSCNAIVDSGTSFLTAPQFAFEAFARRHLLPYKCHLSDDGYYICPREVNLPKIIFLLGENDDAQTFLLNPWDYSRVYSRDEIVVQLQQSPKGVISDSWILGDTFLKTYYTSFAVNDAITFYCRDGICAGGDNFLSFSENITSSWLIGGAVVGAAAACAIVLIFGVWICLKVHQQPRRRHLQLFDNPG